MRTIYLLFPLLLGLAACDNSQSGERAAQGVAERELLAEVSALAERVREGIETDANITGGLANGNPRFLIVFPIDGPKPDYDSIAKAISSHEAVQAFEGDLRISFEAQTKPSKEESPLSGSFQIMRTYNAKTGELIK